jgi:hypothetical protein
MARQDATPQADGATAGARPGFGVGGALIGLGLVALAAVLGFILLSARRNEALRTDAVTSAASALASARAPPAISPAETTKAPAIAGGGLSVRRQGRETPRYGRRSRARCRRRRA